MLESLRIDHHVMGRSYAFSRQESLAVEVLAVTISDIVQQRPGSRCAGPLLSLVLAWHIGVTATFQQRQEDVSACAYSKLGV